MSKYFISPQNTSVSENVNVSWIEDFNKKDVKDEILTCGVCAAKVEGSEWISHIETLHQYLAWVEGQPPIVSINIHFLKVFVVFAT